MNVRYILGSSGSGKLTTCVSEILDSQEKYPNSTNIFIVPEQFSLQAEKTLIESSNSKVILNTKVTSFKRLAYHIFSEIGHSKKITLEDYGQIMILRKIIQNNKEELTYFNNISSYNFGIMEKIIDILQEFLKYNVSLEDLEKILNENLEQESELLFFKIKDLTLIYKNYKEYLKKDYITSEGILDILCEVINKSELIKNSNIWIHGFTGFTPQELKIISEISKISKNITFSLSLNTKNIDIKELYIFDPFYETKNTIKKIDKIIKENNLNLTDIVYLEENKRHLHNLELKYLESNFFSYQDQSYNEKVENIKIYSANNKYLEVENTAQEIINLVRNEEYKFKDIAVILSDKSYDKVIDFIFNKYDIPYFLDNEKSIINHSLTDLICSALDIIIYNWKYDAVFRYLKTGFILNYLDEELSIKQEDINFLENYVIAYGIKGKKWLENSWEYGFLHKKEFDYEQINNTKNLVVKSLKKLNFNKNKKYSIKKITNNLIDFLLELNVLDTLENMSKRDRELLDIKKISDTGKSEEHIQVWNSVVSILEKLVEILGDENVTLEEYSKILKAGLEKGKISLLPPTQDQVIVGDFYRSRLPKVKAVFVLNLNEGVMPRFKDDTDFISDEEKLLLITRGIEISPMANRLLCQDNFYIYSMLTKPSKKLFLSYITSDLEGKAKRPSFVIERVKQLFPKVKILNIDLNYVNIDSFSLNKIYTPNITFEKLINYLNFKEDNKHIHEIFNWFLLNPRYKNKLENIKQGLQSLQSKQNLSLNLVQKLYPNNVFNSSVSKLEQFSTCPFAYFLKYNLRVNERKVYQLDSLDFGIFYHGVLEEFSKLVFNENKSYLSLTSKIIEEYIEISVKNYINTLDTDIFFSSERYNYFLQKIKRIVSFSASSIINQIKNGSFTPYGFEVEFSSGYNNYAKNDIFNSIKIELFNNYKMFLTGKIDRVDLLEYENMIYVKILDYKSSDKNFNLLEFYYGLQLQLLMYIDAFIKFNKDNFNFDKILPAGLFYFKISEPIVKVKKSSDFNNIFKNIQKELNIKGLFSDQVEVIKGLDKNIEKPEPKKIFGISNSTAITKEEFEILRDFVNITTKSIGTEITNGNIKVSPYKYKDKSACKNCLYKSICNIEILGNFGFNSELNYNILKHIEKEEIWDLIRKTIDEQKKT